MKKNNSAIIILIILIICVVVWFVFFKKKSTKNNTTKKEVPEQVTNQAPAEKPTYKIITWNLFNFGKSKNAQELEFIAETVRDFDVLAIQEVSTGPAGPQAVARLADILNRKGAKWDYIVSDATSGDGTERYAYIWKTSKVKLKGKPRLSKVLDKKVDREPFLAHFINKNDSFLLASFHAIPTSKKPETENSLLYLIHKNNVKQNMLFMGDFNQSEKHEAFDNLKKENYLPTITKQKTSLKMKVKNGQKLAKEYDNIFYEKDFFKIQASGIINFADSFRTLKEARKISDHIPIWIEIKVN
ncbi:endonuclease/exonuclease/phosphatase family protein [Chondrinema litorale]|uniref:endonuclease/exonuclease/phosphatase family protein n=1 Tax=Chondrinema litorale TaxID=2994555 RepID=UPI0025439C32|nr:endonuclease/exonuclease/phosphatase family protein [Chondrinema litorale]UZR93398.1 endonuclease/exonuclease/phosphatase family protein [Chondrinema litorale]